MLQINNLRRAEPQTSHIRESLSPAEFYSASIGFLRRQFSVIVLALLVSVALGIVYMNATPSSYTGRAILIVDAPKMQVFQFRTAGEQPIDSATVETQIQILNSEDIALSVIKDLHLDTDPEFVASADTFVSSVLDIFGAIARFVDSGTGVSSVAPTPEYRALQRFQKRLKVKRVQLTYAIEITFYSLNPYRAAQIANAIADAYEMNAFKAKFQVTGKTATWLQDRLTDLREQASDADRAIVDYKAENNIVDAGGQSVNQQQLAELNSKLIQARASTAEAKARLDRVQEIIASNDFDPDAAATVTDTLHNEVITKMREQYLSEERRAADLAEKYGAAHQVVVGLHNEMRELRITIFQELKRTAEGFKSDYAIAKSREDSLQQSLDQMVAASQATSKAQVTLHNLESSAQTNRDLYDNFLQRYMESVQQQSSPVTESRLITHARPPLTRSWPKPLVVLGLAVLGGLILGSGIGILRDVSDRVFRTSEQIVEHLQAECISIIPLVKKAAGPIASFQKAKPINAAVSSKRAKGRVVLAIIKDIVLRVLRIAELAGRYLLGKRRRRRRRRRILSLRKAVCWTVANAPFSRFSESIRAVKVAADISDAGKAHKTIGITSSLPSEGKSTVALSLATLIAQGGGRAILVDCDLRNPALSRMLAPDARAGVVELIKGKAVLENVLWREPNTGLVFLPAPLRSALPNSSDLLAAQATRTLFEQLRGSYDYVIIDLSPVAPVVDARVMAPLVDSFLFVIEWGRTRIEVVELALSNARGICDNLLGVVLNKTDMKALRRYTHYYHDSYYNNSLYSRYGYAD
jgi:polysaccharide biosynthesis transport protein